MEKTGLIDKLAWQLNVSYESYSKSENTTERKLNKTDIKETAHLIHGIGKEKNLNMIINAERIILRHEAQFYGADNPQALKSINEAVKEFDGASRALEIVKDKKLYQAANDTHSPKDRDRKNGLPKDAFPVFTNSHKTRLGNRIRMDRDIDIFCAFDK